MIFRVGDRVLTNRFYGATAFVDAATVVEVRATDYVVEYDDKAMRHEGDYTRVGRYARGLRMVVKGEVVSG